MHYQEYGLFEPVCPSSASRSQLDGRFIWQVVGCARSLPSTVVKVFQPSPVFSKSVLHPLRENCGKVLGQQLVVVFAHGDLAPRHVGQRQTLQR